MRRFAAIVFLAAASCYAQEPREASAEHRSGNHAEGDKWIYWKWANFAILAGLLGYFIVKKAPVFFATRTEEIQKAISEATGMRSEADARAASIEQRMSNLAAEVEALRKLAREDMEKEAERIRRASADQLAKVQANAEHEIVSLTRSATQNLRAYAGDLAIEMARQRIRGRITPDAQSSLVNSFLQNLGRVDSKQDGHSSNRGVN